MSIVAAVLVGVVLAFAGAAGVVSVVEKHETHAASQSLFQYGTR